MEDVELREAIERLFGSVDVRQHKVAWFEEDGVRRKFVSYGVFRRTRWEAREALLAAIRHDARKEEGEPVVGDKRRCRLAWRMYPVVDKDADRDGYIAICRLVYWPEVKMVDPFLTEKRA